MKKKQCRTLFLRFGYRLLGQTGILGRWLKCPWKIVDEFDPNKANGGGGGDNKRELPSGQWRELKTQAFPSPSGVVDESIPSLECSLDGS